MATGPHNVSPAAYSSLPGFPAMQGDAKSSMPRLMAPPSTADFFLRPPPGLVTTSANGTPHRDPASLLGGMFPPLGFMGPLTSQFDPTAAAAAAAMAVAGSGKLSPSSVPTTSVFSADFPGAAAAAAAAMQAAGLKMPGARPQRPMPPMSYDKVMPNMFFPRPEMPGVPPPLGIRPQMLSQGPGPCENLFQPPGCGSSPFGASTPSAKLPSPVLPHAANRPSFAMPPKASEASEKNSVDTSSEKSSKSISAEKNIDSSNSISESENGCISANEVNSINEANPQSSNNNNNCTAAKMASKSSGEYGFEDRTQTEDEVQKLMSIALSNNQKRLERACLNASDKTAVGRPFLPNGETKNEEASSVNGSVEAKEVTEQSSPKGNSQEENADEEILKSEQSEEQPKGSPVPEEKQEEVVKNKEESQSDEKEAEENGNATKQPEFCVPEDPASHEHERSFESGRLSVESDESMTSSNVEQLVANAQPDKEGLFFCHLCDFTGNTRLEFQDHMNWHYDFRCPKCDYTSRTEGRLNRHIRDFHSDVPPLNFSGKVTRANKPKTHKCKQCNYVALTKTDFWAHSRTHIKEDKILECPKCDFVTEYKHHLEYHIRNHFGSKPYKCEKCNYECVNKSMLNSHMKSHTNVYQYRCADCQYATKYCHSLKLHLGKYAHRPATILNSDGSLPEYDNSSDILNIKRGPPRGTRLQRLEPGGTPVSGVSMVGSPAPPQPLPFLHAANPMNSLWSLPMPHQAAGLFPGLPNMPPNFLAQGPGLCGAPQGVLAPPPYVLPGHSTFMEEAARSHHAAAAAAAAAACQEQRQMEEAKGKEAGAEVHCNFCEHRFETREALVRHMLQSHRDEHDVFGASLLSGFVPDNMAVMHEEAAAAAAAGSALTGADALDLRSKKEVGSSSPFDNSLGSFFKRSIAQAVAARMTPDEEPTVKRPRSGDAGSPSGLAPSEPTSGRKRPRKSKAFRLDDLSHLESAGDRTDSASVSPELPVKKEVQEEESSSAPGGDSRMDESCDSSALASLEVADRELEALAQRQECHHCNIIFRDRTMFEMHMGYHGYGNPFKCNRCGHTSPDSVQFFIHLCQMAHS